MIPPEWTGVPVPRSMDERCEQWKIERDEALRNWKDCERELAIVREANLGLARKLAEVEQRAWELGRRLLAGE